MKAALRIWVVMVCLCVPGIASAQFAVFDAGNLAQNAKTTLATVEQVYNTAQQIEYTLRQIEMMERNLKRLSVEDWRSARAAYYQLQGVYYQSKFISMRWERIAQQYDATYEKYDPRIHDGQTYQQKRKKWAEQTDDAIKNAMVSHGVVENYEERDKALSQMLEASRDSAGILAAVQAGNEIAAVIARQMMELTELIVADSRARLSHLKEEQMVNDAARKKSGHSLMRGYGEGQETFEVSDERPRFR